MDLIIRQTHRLAWLLDSHCDNGFFRLRIKDMVDVKLSPESISITERRN